MAIQMTSLRTLLVRGKVTLLLAMVIAVVIVASVLLIDGGNLSSNINSSSGSSISIIILSPGSEPLPNASGGTSPGVSQAVTTTSLTVSASSTGNRCFVNGYDSNITTINSIYWECGATLKGGQSIKQNIFRSTQLTGAFTISINASQAVTVKIEVNGVIVFSQTGTTIKYSGIASNSESMYFTVSNSEKSDTTYEFGIDWTGV